MSDHYFDFNKFNEVFDMNEDKNKYRCKNCGNSEIEEKRKEIVTKRKCKKCGEEEIITFILGEK